MNNAPQPFPLFKGATRTPTFLGVPYVPFMLVMATIASIGTIVGLAYWLLVFPAWFIMAQITRQDDMAFRTLWLWYRTKFLNKNKGFWGASSYSPRDYRKKSRILK